MKLAISIDCGASLTKIIYRLWKSQKDYVTAYEWMQPEIEQVLGERIDEYFEYKGWMGLPDPKQQAYIEVEGNYFVVGKFAANFDPEDRVFQRKYENALYKVLAAVGVALENQQVKTKKPIEVWVSVLLPWDEYSDRDRFKNRLVELLSNYKFRGQSIKVKASSSTILVRPEGGGLAALYILKKGREFFKGKKIGIAMFGHQNLTGLLFEDGVLAHGDSPKMGLSWFLDRVIQITSGLEREKLCQAILAAIKELGIDMTTPYVVENSLNHTPSGEAYRLGITARPKYDENYESIKSLGTARDDSLLASEIEDISLAIKKAEGEYFEKVEKWLRKMFPVREIDYLIVSGGAVPFLKQMLEKYCNSYRRVAISPRDKTKDYIFLSFTGEHEYQGLSAPFIKLISDCGLAGRVRKELNINWTDLLQLSLHKRLVDNYGVFEYLLEKEKKHEAQVRAAKAAKAARERGTTAIQSSQT